MRKYAALLVMVPITMVLALLVIIVCLVSRRKGPTAIMQLWARLLLLSLGVRVELEGREHVDPANPSIYMANHASMIDIPVLIAALPVDLRFIFKKSLSYIPFVGQAIVLMGMIPIDRTKRERAIQSLRKAGRRIRNGSHVLIFPEGTRSHQGELLPFKKGGFLLAIQEKIDILPITLCNSRELCGRNSILAKPGSIKMVIHPRVAINQHKIKDRAALIEQVRTPILETLPSLSSSPQQAASLAPYGS